MAVAAELNPEVRDADLLAQSLGPEAVGVPLVDGDDVLVVDLRADPLLLSPDPAAIGPLRGPDSAVEELHPRGRASIPQRLHIVLDVQQPAAVFAVVDNVEDGVPPTAAADALKPTAVAHGQLLTLWEMPGSPRFYRIAPAATGRPGHQTHRQQAELGGHRAAVISESVQHLQEARRGFEAIGSERVPPRHGAVAVGDEVSRVAQQPVPRRTRPGQSGDQGRRDHDTEGRVAPHPAAGRQLHHLAQRLVQRVREQSARDDGYQVGVQEAVLQQRRCRCGR